MVTSNKSERKFSKGRAREKKYLFAPGSSVLKETGVSEINWKDVSLLKKFISDRGKIRPRALTGITLNQQRQIAQAIKNAREMALLPYTERKKVS
jgi:small subunit ribosomal protein S18